MTNPSEKPSPPLAAPDCSVFPDRLSGSYAVADNDLKRDFGTTEIQSALRCHPEIQQVVETFAQEVGQHNVKAYIANAPQSPTACVIGDNHKWLPESTEEKYIYLSSLLASNPNSHWRGAVGHEIGHETPESSPLYPSPEIQKALYKRVLDNIIKAGYVKDEALAKQMADLRIKEVIADYIGAELAGPQEMIHHLKFMHQHEVFNTDAPEQEVFDKEKLNQAHPACTFREEIVREFVPGPTPANPTLMGRKQTQK